MRDELSSRLAIHSRLREIRRDRRNRRLPDVGRRRRDGWTAVVAQPPDAPLLRDLVELILFNLRAQIRPWSGPLQLLNDPVIHVRNVDGPVRSVADIHRAEE